MARPGLFAGADIIRPGALALILAGSFLLLSGCSRFQKQILMQKGIDAEKKGNYDTAIADYSEAIQLNPKYALAYNNRGFVYEAKGDYDKAIVDFNQAIQLDPKFERAYYNRGVAHAQKGDFDKAFVDYDQAIQINPEDDKAYGNRGFAHEQKGDYDKAIADCDAAIRLNPKNANTYKIRGLAYSYKGDYNKANADFSEGLHLDPKDPNLYRFFAELLASCPQASYRDGKKAVEYATKACELSEWKDPNMLPALAAAYAEVEDFDNAVKWEMKYLESPNLSGKDMANSQYRLILYQAHKPYHADE